jgi:F-type H+-transporting ATPase subunit gamma
MANLKELRNTIGVVQSTRKVTAAMKLVAGVKLKKAEQKASTSREYVSELENLLARVPRECAPVKNCELFWGRDEINTEMLVVFASDKGLCGNFNYLINRETLNIISRIRAKNRKVNILCIGVKAFDFLKHELPDESIEFMGDFYKNEKLFENSNKLAEKIIADFHSKKVDGASIVYTKCYSAMRHQVETKPLIPLGCESNFDEMDTIFEPDVKFILDTVLPYNIAIQLYQTALESIASEQGSRMTSMDSATRNADELLSNLTIKYNRTRQYNITQELVEVVSGATAIREG